VLRCRDLGAERTHQPTASLCRGEQRREDGCGRHVVDRPSVDAADERVDQRVDHAAPELARHQRADGAVTHRAPQVRAGQQRVTSQPELAAHAEDPAARRGPERRGYAERQLLGQRAQPSARPHRGPAGRDRDERVAQAHLATEIDGLRPAPEEAVGAHVDRPAVEGVAADDAAQPRTGFEDGDVRRVPARLGAAGQLPGRGEPADATAHHDDVPGRHVTRSRRPPARRQPAPQRRQGRR